MDKELSPLNRTIFSQLELASWTLDGSEEHRGRTSMLGTVCSHYAMLKHSCIATETQRIRQVGSHGKDSFGLLE